VVAVVAQRSFRTEGVAVAKNAMSRAQSPADAGQDAKDLYLRLLAMALSGGLQERVLSPVAPSGRKRRIFEPIRRLLESRGLLVARSTSIDEHTFADSPPPRLPGAETLIGPRGLDNIRGCVEQILEDDVPGDLIETGVWRGGAAAFMRAVLKAHDETRRTVWAADSFRGLPSPAESGYEADVGEEFWAELDWLNVSLEDVKRTFEKYGLLDEQVQFLVGWFAETLPSAPIEKLALIRLDGDMYGSTMDALNALYPRLSPGGYVIVDDYWLTRCRAAVDDYRREHGITDTIRHVDRAIAYWRRASFLFVLPVLDVGLPLPV
jgi:O-methyltransferase